ncbi:MAG: hypothetical protein ACEPOZ_10585 [Marinifilaceae bacterium]|jgi:hypothetical protein
MKRKLVVIMGLLVSMFSYGQSKFVADNLEDGKFIKVGAGFNKIKFRDMATSPLFYEGSLKHFDLGFVKCKEGKERELNFSFSTGKAGNTTNKHSSLSTVSIYNLNYSKLYPVWNKDKWNFKAGGELSNTFHMRSNPSFQNNATGIEVVSTLFASGKISWDISNKKRKRARLLFIPMNFRPRKRDLSFQMKMAVMNNTYRNGYAYINNSDVINNPSVWDDYQFKMFSGYRIGTEMNYTVTLENSNAIRLGYEFDAYRTGGDLDKFAMANHVLKIALLFKTK